MKRSLFSILALVVSMTSFLSCNKQDTNENSFQDLLLTASEAKATAADFFIGMDH